MDGVATDDILVVDRGAGMELHTHGSPALQGLLTARFGIRDPRTGAAAEPPAAALLREALSPQQLALALEQQRYDWASCMSAALALPADARAELLAAALLRSRVAMAHVEVPRVVLAGQQNAGKSTLFNRLLFRERSVVGPLPGLTRDAVRERTALAGFPYELIDIAGEGHAVDSIDVQAIEAGRELQRGAIVVLVVDASRGPGDVDRAMCTADTLVVASKSDLPRAAWPDGFPRHLEIAAEFATAGSLRDALGQLLQRRRALPGAGPVGGFAALTPSQLAQLQAAADGTSDPGRAASICAADRPGA
ncbi:MAG: 50S ribosome-binding GTPase [Planctomycetes bacterium]|nr:50S ribosome-binding GTPase [Planctomycetota bacterium]